MGLLTQASVAIDGSKFKAVNNRDKNFTRAKMQRRLEQIEESVARYLHQMDSADRQEPSLANTTKTTRLKEKIAKLREEMQRLKTLAARMDRHCRNAMRVAQMLAEHPAVSEVLYPGLPSHPGHKTAQEQMRAFGGMVSFRLLAGEEAAVRACGRTRLFTLGESLGGVESLIEHPARMTHASVTGSPLEVPGDLIRLSVGIEDCDDLLDDLRQAVADT